MPSRKYRKSPKKSLRRSRKPISTSHRKCNRVLSAKIRKNLEEYKRGRYVSRAQAIAVSYSQVRKSHTKCKKYY